MTVKKNILYRIQGISLKLKLLIPFLFFAFAGTTILTIISTTSQQNIIRNEEKNMMLHHYRHFIETLKQKESQSLSIASTIAEIPEVKHLLLMKKRNELYNHLAPVYEELKKNYNISQFHFHIPPGISFLRFHKPDKYGDKVESYRKTVSLALEQGESSSCLEKGATGFGIRGVSPVYNNGEIVGSIGIGYSFGKAFLDDFQKSWGINAALYSINKQVEYELIASTGDLAIPDISSLYTSKKEDTKPVILLSPGEYPDRSIIIGPVMDCYGNKVALITLNTDRSEIIQRLSRTRSLMIAIGFAVMLISFLFTFIVVDLFIKSIREIVDETRDITLGKRESRLEVKPSDEVGKLSKSLNDMLEALRQRRIEIEAYAKTLEKRVEARTFALVASEEKYRTLVENVPLIVYRVLKDGTTEFVNSYLTENTGYEIEEVIGDKYFWRDKICSEAPAAFNTIYKTCVEKGEDCRIDHPVRAKDGRMLYFITHAIPSKDEGGEVKWIDGFMLDITELKRLQERAIQTEEIRTLGEISARMAHEIRNPLSAAGGFARRLRDALKNDDQNKKLANIIVEEVAKLEKFVKGLLATITPFDLTYSEIDLNKVILDSIINLSHLLKSRKLEVITVLDSDLPGFQADYERIKQSIENIIKHAAVSAPQEESIAISSSTDGQKAVVEISHKMPHLSDDDIEQFFFPHIEPEIEESVLDLPLAKIIIHRHGGRIGLARSEESVLNMIIEIPFLQE